MSRIWGLKVELVLIEYWEDGNIHCSHGLDPLSDENWDTVLRVCYQPGLLVRRRRGSPFLSTNFRGAGPLILKLDVEGEEEENVKAMARTNFDSEWFESFLSDVHEWALEGIGKRAWGAFFPSLMNNAMQFSITCPRDLTRECNARSCK